MLADYVVWFAKALVKIVGQHRRRALDHLFSRLADEHQCAVPLALALGHLFRHADQHGHVQIVATGMHHRYRLSIRPRLGHVARELQAGFLRHRQGVHIGADHQPRPGSVLEDRDYAVRLRAVGIFAHMLGDRVTQLAQFAGQEG